MRLCAPVGVSPHDDDDDDITVVKKSHVCVFHIYFFLWLCLMMLGK